MNIRSGLARTGSFCRRLLFLVGFPIRPRSLVTGPTRFSVLQQVALGVGAVALESYESCCLGLCGSGTDFLGGAWGGVIPTRVETLEHA